MAGHSHWAGIKHKKGRQDKERSKLFSKLSREITVAARLGAKDPDTNPRLRSAIQSARQSNMPKDNIERAINKSEISSLENYQSLRYEGFGPSNTAFIIETLTDNKNRSASKIRTILQKNGGRLGENGSTNHMFYNCGVLRFKREVIDSEKIIELAINAGAQDCNSFKDYHEITCNKEDFYNVKNNLERNITETLYSDIEWRPKILHTIPLTETEKVKEIIDELNDNEDVQKIFTNCNITQLNK
tara:strand:- start:893 stop:1624 length:732 start_codon:yes stop_codon:yes gene_type:complete